MATISYKKHTWVNDTEPAINQTNLNDIEDGISAVTALANSNSDAISAEATRAKAAEADLNTKADNNSTAITAEASRAKNAEADLNTKADSNSAAITAEASRAKDAETAITKQLNGFHLFVNSNNKISITHNIDKEA